MRCYNRGRSRGRRQQWCLLGKMLRNSLNNSVLGKYVNIFSIFLLPMNTPLCLLTCTVLIVLTIVTALDSGWRLVCAE